MSDKPKKEYKLLELIRLRQVDINQRLEIIELKGKVEDNTNSYLRGLLHGAKKMEEREKELMAEVERLRNDNSSMASDIQFALQIGNPTRQSANELIERRDKEIAKLKEENSKLKDDATAYRKLGLN